MGTLSPEVIAVTHTAFLLKYLRSNIMRRDEEDLPEFFSAFGDPNNETPVHLPPRQPFPFNLKN